VVRLPHAAAGRAARQRDVLPAFPGLQEVSMTAGPRRVAVLGAGKMGEALLSGMLRAGKPARDLVVTVRSKERAELLRERYGVEVAGNAEAAKGADTLILAVKP